MMKKKITVLRICCYSVSHTGLSACAEVPRCPDNSRHAKQPLKEGEAMDSREQDDRQAMEEQKCMSLGTDASKT